MTIETHGLIVAKFMGLRMRIRCRYAKSTAVLSGYAGKIHEKLLKSLEFVVNKT